MFILTITTWLFSGFNLKPYFLSWLLVARNLARIASGLQKA